MNLGNGDGEVADGAKLTCHDRPDHCIIAFNTLIGNAVTYQMDGRKDGLDATHTTFTCNLNQGDGKVVAIGGPHPGATWTGNLVWQSGPAGDLPTGGATSADPRLVADAAGVLHLSAGSLALGVDSSGGFPAVNVDQDGQPRPRARLATPADGGPPFTR